MIDPATPDRLSPGAARCRQEASLCRAGERCPCDLRPSEADLSGPRGLRRVDAADGHASEVDHVLQAEAATYLVQQEAATYLVQQEAATYPV